jgi:hypothetical protein
MSQAMIKACFLVMFLVGGWFAVTSGRGAAPSADPAVRVASLSQTSTDADRMAAEPTPVEIPADLRLADEAEPMACDFSTCFSDCNATGWCEGSCVAGTCKCRFRRTAGSQCP